MTLQRREVLRVRMDLFQEKILSDSPSRDKNKSEETWELQDLLGQARR